MLSCTRKLHFCAGHRVLGHEGKCNYPHGHNYNVELTAVTDVDLVPKNYTGNLITGQDTVGRVVDFSVLKHVYDTWIQQYWDHGFLIYEKDKELIKAFQDLEYAKLVTYDWNPTAENIANFLLRDPHFVQGLAQYHVKVSKVVVHETENCFATAEL